MHNGKKLHKLKYWRGVLGLRQEDVATLIGCKKAYYCEKENGKAEIGLSEMLTIQKAFNKKLEKMGSETVLILDDIFLP
ncbi:MAG: helix-turn-helix protein [Herbinix sp.]|nr:helix-turn-helix protein [Herbinix sp.]